MTSTGNFPRDPLRHQLLIANQDDQQRSEAATIFSRTRARPYPLIRSRLGATSSATIDSHVQGVGLCQRHQWNAFLPRQACGGLRGRHPLGRADLRPGFVHRGAFDERLSRPAGSQTNPRSVRHQFECPFNDGHGPS